MPIFNTEGFFHQFLYDEKNPLLFNNGFFVFFFTAFLCLYYIFRNKIAVRRYIFCFFSLYFFYKASGAFVGLVIISAIVDFVLSNAIFSTAHQLKKRLLLIVSVMFNLGMLFYFKYTNFFISLSNELFHAGFHPLNILLPVGISFYTFENLSYTIDVYRGELEPARKFSDYLLFLSFFPKLVMGPIVRAHDFVPQINKPYQISDNDFAKGFYLIVSGLFKKLIISDYLTLNYVNYIFDDPARYTGMENLFAVYGYAAVIYCDFSGYSDVAIGIARWLGFTIPTNFLSPYQSSSITEFWRRWHISLSSWLKDYLYIPLGGNRKGSWVTLFFTALFFTSCYFIFSSLLGFAVWLSAVLCLALLVIFILPSVIKRSKGGLSTNFNLMTTMFLGGLWHGASLNFIFWGSLHGVGLGIHKLWMIITGGEDSGVKRSRLYKMLAGIITFHFVCFCWIFFKASDFNTAAAMIHQIGFDWDWKVWSAFFGNYHNIVYMILLVMVMHLIPDNTIDKILLRFKRIPLLVYVLLFFGFVLTYGYFKSAEQVLPIYLQF